MQLFIPLLTVEECVQCLDMRRLGKQRLEALQLLKLLRPQEEEPTNSGNTNKKRGYINHPLVAMYRGYDDFVAYYYNSVVLEWVSRGYKNTMVLQPIRQPDCIQYPSWWLDSDIHQRHKENLVYKLPSHYGALWQDVKPTQGYYWCNADGSNKRLILPKTKTSNLVPKKRQYRKSSNKKT